MKWLMSTSLRSDYHNDNDSFPLRGYWVHVTYNIIANSRCHGDTSVARKYVKNQKCVREQIARMSSKAMFRVAEDVASLKQLLALVSSALQRNAVAIDKLKLESAQVRCRVYLAVVLEDIWNALKNTHTG